MKWQQGQTSVKTRLKMKKIAQLGVENQDKWQWQDSEEDMEMWN